MNGQFWMVWNPAARPPVVRHPSEQAATQEAERLARLNPGEQFFVLEAISLRCVDNMKRVDLRNAEPDEIPF